MARGTTSKRRIWGRSLVPALMLSAAMAAALAGTAKANLSIADLQQVAEETCARQVFKGFGYSASAERCDDPFFIPTSASVKCGLYRDAGYPSSLMRKACQLYDRGAMEFFLEDASAEQ